MTEAEWLTGVDTMLMRRLPAVMASSRKLRLFGTACCRLLDRWLSEPARKALDAAERYADAEVTRRTLGRRGRELHRLPDGSPRRTGRDPESLACHAVGWMMLTAPAGGWYMVAEEVRQFGDALGAESPGDLGGRCLAVKLDVFGNPFRPVRPDPSWLTSTVVELARGLYTDRAFDRLPILADALQDAGCEHPDVLDHCWGPAPHVRGCWVVDLLLGKG
jgi:hypothetical protein